MRMVICNCSSYSCQLRSPYGVGYTFAIRFNQARVACNGVVNTCPNDLFAFVDVAAAICIGPGFPVSNFEGKDLVWIDGKGGALHPRLVCDSNWQSVLYLSGVSQTS